MTDIALWKNIRNGSRLYLFFLLPLKTTIYFITLTFRKLITISYLSFVTRHFIVAKIQ
jgi:hypothetical protein